MSSSDTHEEVRSGVRALCAQFPDEYFRKVDLWGRMVETIRTQEDRDLEWLVVSGSALVLLWDKDSVSDIFRRAVLITSPGQGSEVMQLSSSVKDVI